MQPIIGLIVIKYTSFGTGIVILSIYYGVDGASSGEVHKTYGNHGVISD